MKLNIYISLPNLISVGLTLKSYLKTRLCFLWPACRSFLAFDNCPSSYFPTKRSVHVVDCSCLQCGSSHMCICMLCIVIFYNFRAGKPPPGLHLDVLKESKMVQVKSMKVLPCIWDGKILWLCLSAYYGNFHFPFQKLMIDEKKCYFFGRNKQLCDFCIDHASCSRVHAALVWHKHLNRPFVIDLGSSEWNLFCGLTLQEWCLWVFFPAHGTFIGTIRLDPKKPQQVPIDSILHFGASTRNYIIRERPQTMTATSGMDGEKAEDMEGGLLGLPETETELEVWSPLPLVEILNCLCSDLNGWCAFLFCRIWPNSTQLITGG